MIARTIACGLLLLIAGCRASQPSRGWVTGAELGKAFPDFVYVEANGTQRSLRNLAGEFTVLAFTRCDQDTHGPAAAALHQIVSENAGTSFVRVVGVDVHWFDGQCDHGHCHLVQDQRNLFSICDATGAVRRLYGINGNNAAVVIGPDGRVIQIAPEFENEEFRAELRSMIVDESNRRAEELAQKYENISLGG
ncbi:MAG: hypothetical protein IPK83_14040 [Planctomycetes bacterium]|nr:hypothetical protein [Planctomycetota bacterium]